MRRMMTALILLCAHVATADIELPSFFSDHMVIQRDMPVPVWGKADPGAMVQVTFNGNTAVGRADEFGRFMVSLPPMQADATPHPMTIDAGASHVKINDVLVGEVWLCAGQSNMVWHLRNTLDGETFIEQARESRIRMFTIPNTASHTPRENCQGQWQPASPETAGQFSAVAYHFGRHLIDELDVPIGLVNASWGGSTVEAWVSRPVLDAIEMAHPFLEAYDAFHDADSIDVSEFVNAEVDTSDWIDIELPALIEDAGHDTDGIFWFRRTVTNGLAGEELELTFGAIDDNDVTFVNGVRVGATNNWQAPRSYRVPAAVSDPTLTIAIRVEDTGGAGGFSGTEQDMKLMPAEGDGQISLSLAGPWKMKIVSTRPSGPTQHRPANLYNGMIHPLRHMALRGVIWYQGESNAIRPRGEEYLPIFMGMIENWRDVFESPGLPFYYVQLPLFTNDEPNTVWRYPVVRQAQLDTMRLVPNTGMAITLDLGEANDIHPRNKHDVGERLARWALSETYAVEGVVATGPIVRDASFAESSVTLSFDLYGSSLRVPETRLSGFEVAGADGVFHPARARVEGDAVLVMSEQVREPVAVRYAWLNNPSEANLRNEIGIPASPFLIQAD